MYQTDLYFPHARHLQSFRMIFILNIFEILWNMQIWSVQETERKTSKAQEADLHCVALINSVVT